VQFVPAIAVAVALASFLEIFYLIIAKSV